MAKAKAVADIQLQGAEIGQIGAIPLIRVGKGEFNVILVTTRGSGRWTIPKGNPIKGMPLHKAACVEALEEAGLVGRAKKTPLGSYQFWKRQEDHWQLATVLVFGMVVDRQLDDFKEKGEREVRAFSLIAAHDNVVEPGLQALLRKLRKKPTKIGVKKGKSTNAPVENDRVPPPAKQPSKTPLEPRPKKSTEGGKKHVAKKTGTKKAQSTKKSKP